ncbi:general substrate transporter [Leucosporidium creatinivorum]|uniref:General substrate transporter n=1 Tax=Leucosporidium creatinivorum TaxID=106004 RepID=A0A1Y2CRQ6_9BASI|nr:general substrate transporter [Leucosporidium creatinivorum]
MSTAVAIAKTSKMAVLMTCFAAFGGFLYGYDTGYISGVKEMDGWLELFGTFNAATNKYEITSGDNSLITSILSAGTFVGALGAYPVGDRLGRRFGIIAYLGLFCIGVALQTGATSIPPFVVGRVFAGLGVGGTSCLVPMYQSECAPKHIRGGIVAAYQWMITIGLLIAAVIVNGTKDMAGASCYRIPIGLQFIWAAILGGGLAILPESPRYLIMKGRDEAAQKALSRILGAPMDSPQVHEEYAEIAANLHHERAVGATSYLACFQNGAGRNGLRMWTGIGIQALQQLTGINFIFYYGTQFFKNSGIQNPFIITIATNVVNVGMTVPGIWGVDHFGRRGMLLLGAAGMCISQIIVAAVGVAIDADNLAGQRVLIAFVCFFIAFFAATWGPLAWVVTGEIYPTSIRAKAMSMSTASNWLLNFAIGYATPYLVDDVPGSAGLGSNVFWIWGGCCVCCFVFVFFLVPETKGLSLEQVDILYRNSSILKSNAFRKQILAENMHDEDKEAYQQNKSEAGQAQHVEKRDLGDATV